MKIDSLLSQYKPDSIDILRAEKKAKLIDPPGMQEKLLCTLCVRNL